MTDFIELYRDLKLQSIEILAENFKELEINADRDFVIKINKYMRDFWRTLLLPTKRILNNSVLWTSDIPIDRTLSSRYYVATKV